ncbi:MAG: hypothetical protein BWY87_00918 [Deltaproteobacteria bacterium ADurb.Bin510]|nr:MAG: hypothetical protein BWY87_00918 [Deltaproteobacteria bacterium ADurb.Bin510]
MKNDVIDVSASVSLSIDREGRWYYDGQEIIHPRVLETFRQGLRCDSDGRHFIEIGGEICSVAVADAPFVVTTLRGDCQQGLRLVLNSGETVRLDPSRLRLGAGGAFYTEIRDGLQARFTRAAHALLAQEVFELEDGYALEIEGRIYRLAAG